MSLPVINRRDSLIISPVGNDNKMVRPSDAPAPFLWGRRFAVAEVFAEGDSERAGLHAGEPLEDSA